MKRVIVAAKTSQVDLELAIRIEYEGDDANSVDTLWKQFAKQLEKTDPKITWTSAKVGSILSEDSFGGFTYYLLEYHMSVEMTNSSNPKKDLEAAYFKAASGKFNLFSNCSEFSIR